jgi:putative DNA primase/helicase
MTAVAPDAECPTLLWSAFLDKVMDGDKEMIGFLKRMSGYGLTGLTIEHVLFFLFGDGRNGKGVFINTMSGIMKDYHRVAPISTFVAGYNEQHSTDLAMLRGARLVTASETEDGQRWAEAKIKQMTGGDRISARFMRQDFFEYMPQFKLEIIGNKKPGINAVDEAIRSRIKLVRFSVFIPPEERDKDLGSKLVAEWPGILAWMIAGCVEWQRIGLSPPQAVEDATKEYLEAEDTIQLWLNDACRQGKDLWSSFADLFDCWKTWAETSGEFVGSGKRFSSRLESYGFKPMKKDNQRGFYGLSMYMPESNKEWIWKRDH